MEDPVTTQDNQPAANGSPDNNGAGSSLENIMGSMAQSKAPEAKPEEGKQPEGTEKSQQDIPAWTSQLPEEIRSNADVMKQLTKFGKIGDLAKSYSELESKIGNSIVRPGKEASNEEVETFYQKLGKPKSADGYTIDDKDATMFKELAYKNNLTDEQAKGVFQALKEVGNAYIQNNAEKLKAAAKATETSLQKEYGSDYAAKLELCKRGVLAYGGPSLGQKLQDSGLLFDEEVVKMFIKLGEQSAEAGTAVKGAANSNAYKSTAEGGSFTFKGL